MSVLAEHPNATEARALRRAEIEHAMRCLYRDPTWIDPDGSLEVIIFLRRIHYLRPDVPKGWMRGACIDPLTTVGELDAHERERLLWQMIRFLKGSGAGSDNPATAEDHYGENARVLSTVGTVPPSRADPREPPYAGRSRVAAVLAPRTAAQTSRGTA